MQVGDLLQRAAPAFQPRSWGRFIAGSYFMGVLLRRSIRRDLRADSCAFLTRSRSLFNSLN
jgi:hypothetical protein